MKTNLSSTNIAAYEKQQQQTQHQQQPVNAETRSSPGSSPRGSPRPSPRPQSKRDHSKSDTLLSVNYGSREQSIKTEGSPSSQEGSSRERTFNSSNIEISSPSLDNKPTESSSSGKDKREGRGKKKSSWFNSFYPSYKSRSEDFKRLFKGVPDDERLVVDYSCALQKEILVQGRLYVTQNYLGFYANIFGWETNLTLKWKDVTSITKEKTALVIPNAVMISTKSDKYFFTSFVARDKTYLMLFRVWQNALMDQPMSPQEMWQWVHQCYGSELGLTSDDEDYIAPNITEDDKLPVRLSVESFSEIRGLKHLIQTLRPVMFTSPNSRTAKSVMKIISNNYKNRLTKTAISLIICDWTKGDRDDFPGLVDGLTDSLSMSDRQDLPDELMRPTVLSSGPKQSGSESHIPTDITDNSESEAEKVHKKSHTSSFLRNKKFPKKPIPRPQDSDASVSDIFMPQESVHCTCPHEGRRLLNLVVPIHIDQLFTLLFTSSKFYLDFHAARKTTDLTQTPWAHNPLNDRKSRIVSSNVTLLATMGPKSAQVTETQMMLPCSKAGNLYSIDIETVNAGVPYADSFMVYTHYCLQKVSETHTSLTVFAQVKYKKSVWGFVKGMIERNCYAGMEDYLNHLSRALQVEGESVPEMKRKSRRKRRMHSILPRSISEDRISIPLRKKIHGDGLFSTDVCTLVVFSVLLLLLFLNIMLYYKLWSLEETPTYTLLDLHLLKNPPKNHEEWIELIQQQENLHTIEGQKWQKLLKNAIHLLRQAEESLSELQRSIHVTYTNKMPVASQESNEENSHEDTEL